MTCRPGCCWCGALDESVNARSTEGGSHPCRRDRNQVIEDSRCLMYHLPASSSAVQSSASYSSETIVCVEREAAANAARLLHHSTSRYEPTRLLHSGHCSEGRGAACGGKPASLKSGDPEVTQYLPFWCFCQVGQEDKAGNTCSSRQMQSAMRSDCRLPLHGRKSRQTFQNFGHLGSVVRYRGCRRVEHGTPQPPRRVEVGYA